MVRSFLEQEVRIPKAVVHGALAGVLVLGLLVGLVLGMLELVEAKCDRRAEALGLEGRHRIPGGCFVELDGRELPLENVVVEVPR